MIIREQIVQNLPINIREKVNALSDNVFSELEEIRLRVNKQLMIYTSNGAKPLPHIVSLSEIENCLQIISGASVYAFLEEIKNGFITLSGGHRVGLCGRVVMQGAEVINIKQISGINIRIARQIKGSANGIIPYIVSNDTVQNTLIISPPQCGKTTILRDAARQIGAKYKVSIIDERGEISAVCNGVPQYDVGEMTDTIDLCSKTIVIPLMLRSMSPDVIMTDEIAEEDISAIKQALSCGVKIVATAHGDDALSTIKRIKMQPLIEQFGCVITLSRKNGVGTIEKIIKGSEIV